MGYQGFMECLEPRRRCSVDLVPGEQQRTAVAIDLLYLT